MLLAMWIYDGTFASTKKRYMSEQSKNLKKYIIPAMLANVSFFILTIIDGMFVGNGVGTDALGAVNLALLEKPLNFAPFGHAELSLLAKI